MIVLAETGQTAKVECLRSVVAYAAKPNEEVLKDNPLGKIPALVLDSGVTLFDSRVICEYLDGLHDGRPLLPPNGPARLRQLRWQALGDGMTDMLILWRNEQIRPEGPHPVITAAFDRKLRASMAALDTEAAALSSEEFGFGQIAIICAIGQLDFRFLNNRWKEAYPALAAWHDECLTRASVADTVPEDDPSPVVPGPSFDESKSPIDFMNSH